ncbi:MAG: hypothetical protein U7123_15400 [Potamolinea sp.]
MRHHLKLLAKNLIKFTPTPVRISLSQKVDRLRKLIKVFSYANNIGIEQLLWTIETVEFEYGHFLSFEQKSCLDKSGNPIPWYTYPAIEYLNQLDFSDKEIYEYGAGNSSLFWAKKAKCVTSIEDDKTWYCTIQEKQQENQEILFIENAEEYVNSILRSNKKYDLIIIDGSCRLACAKVAVQCLVTGGLIILDNSDWYPETSKFLRDSGLIQVDFTGMGPINYYTWTTSLFLGRDITLKARSEFQPESGIASLVQRVSPE